MNIRATSMLICATLLLFGSPGLGESDEAEPATRSDEALQITTDAARTYEFELAGEQPRKIVLHTESILRWSNPVAGEVFGSVFVWTHEGRPEVIGSLHQWYSPLTHGSHEFHSLATGPVHGWRDKKSIWISQQPGIELRRVPDQQAVAESNLGHLRQMRAISRRFTVKKTDREGVSRDMRLLSQPIYRYPGNSSLVADGAIFVFVQGTDPELFLLVEARQVKDNWEWQYALARMNSVQFVARYQNRKVWQVDIWPWSKTKNGREPYTQFGPFERPAAND
jgi:hypothetical protein